MKPSLIHGLNLAPPRRTKVMIALPVEQCSITSQIGILLSDCAAHSLTPGKPYEFTIQFTYDRYPTEYARNTLVKYFLESDCDLLWFVDSDTLPSANSLDLLAVDADVACGIYPIYRGDRGNEHLTLDWSLYEQKGEWSWQPIPLESCSPNEIISCDAAATGCMVIKRKVLEHFAKKAVRDEAGVPAVFAWPKHASGKSIASDDLDFCKRLKKAGFSLKVHTGVRWGHMKMRNLSDLYDQIKFAFFSGVDEQRQIEAGEHREQAI